MSHTYPLLSFAQITSQMEIALQCTQKLKSRFNSIGLDGRTDSSYLEGRVLIKRIGTWRHCESTSRRRFPTKGFYRGFSLCRQGSLRPHQQQSPKGHQVTNEKKKLNLDNKWKKKLNFEKREKKFNLGNKWENEVEFGQKNGSRKRIFHLSGRMHSSNCHWEASNIWTNIWGEARIIYE